MIMICSFSKQIRYASRKARADTRKRVKGRFVKAGEAYDYDPTVSHQQDPDSADHTLQHEAQLNR